MNRFIKILLLVVIIVGLVGCEDREKAIQEKVDRYLSACKYNHQVEEVETWATVGFRIYFEDFNGFLQYTDLIFQKDEIEYLCFHDWPQNRTVGNKLRDMYNKHMQKLMKRRGGK